MPEENIAVVRRILAGWERGDFSSGTELLDAEIAFETFMPDTSENVVAHGVGEVNAFTRSWLAQWDDYRIVAEEFRAVGPDKVLVSVRQVATGRRSGAQVESPGFAVWTLRDGKVAGLSLHYDRAEALKAAGLQT